MGGCERFDPEGGQPHIHLRALFIFSVQGDLAYVYYNIFQLMLSSYYHG